MTRTRTVAVMTILEAPLRTEALRLWQLFEDEYGSVGVQTFAHPNLTFGGGRIHETRTLAEQLQALAGQLQPFELRITGIDFFTEPQRAVFLRVEPTEPLAEIHRSVHRVLEQHCEHLFDLYRPEAWVPHITVGMADLSQKNFARARTELSAYDRSFVQPAHQISLIQSTPGGSGYEIVHEWNIGDSGAPPNRLDVLRGLAGGS